jgi:aminoglycoside phosphotransferase (APT) family kinase protein
LDLAAVQAWVDRTAPGLRQGPLQAEVIVGGLSNLTYRVTDSASTWALRRPPLGHVLSTAHDMTREFRVLTALHGTAVPVAAPVILCEDVDVNGAPFYLMAYVDGVVLDKPEVLERLTPADAGRACELLVDTLLALHAIDPVDVGLEEFGRPHGFLERQLKRWRTQWEASETEPRAGLEELVAGLADRIPQEQPAGIVHGDYRLTNVLYSHDITRIAAVVDWEMATLGDPLTDVGLLVAYQSLGEQGLFGSPMSPAEGFLSSHQTVERYAAGTTRDLTALPWYVAFAWFKLAVIAEGIHARYLQGKTVGDGFGGLGVYVPRLLGASRQWLDRL